MVDLLYPVDPAQGSPLPADDGIVSAAIAANAAEESKGARDVAIEKAGQVLSSLDVSTEKAAEAQASANIASASATTATTKAGEASDSAGVATTKASEASASAQVATTKASEANASAGVATTKAGEANVSASSAAADRVQTGLDRAATTGDRAQTNLDKIATAADRIQTGLDREAVSAAAVTAGAPVLQTLTDRPAITFDVSAGKYASVTLGGNRSLYFSKTKAGEEYKLIVFQDATGGRTLSFSSRVKWVNDVAPTISSGANTMTVLRFVSNGVMLYGVVDQIYDGYAPSAAIDFRDPNIYNDMPAWLDYSGTTGNRMYVDHTGKLTWAPNNILLNSATLATQTVSVASGLTKILSFTGAGSVTLSGAATGTLAGTGANNRVSLVITPSTSSLTLTVSGDVRMAQLERVTYQTTPRAWLPTTSAAVYLPRFHYNPLTLQPLGLLREYSATNHILQSQSFNVSWSLSGLDSFGSGSVINAMLSPDGTQTADFIRPTTASAVHHIGQAISTTVGRNTFSVYAKSGGYNFVLLLNATAGVGRVFNLSSGQLGGTSGQVAPLVSEIEALGDGFYRCSITLETTAASNIWRIYPLNTDGSTVFAGDGVSGINIWGAQVNVGSLTSYIPTTTASVTRAADVFKASGAAQTILGANTGTAIMQARVSSITSYVNLLGDANRVLLWADANTTLKSSSQTPTPAVLSATIGGAGTWTGGAVRAAVSWSAAGRAIVANNGTVASDSNTFGTATDVPIFSVGNGTIESMALYSIILPDAVEKTKSTVGAAF